MLAELWCRLSGGHYWIRTSDAGATWLQCMHCPARTKGWKV